MSKFILKGPTDSVIDPKTFIPIGIGGSPLLIVTPFEQRLIPEVTDWLDETFKGKWWLDNDGKDYFILFENDADMNWFTLRWS